MKRTLIFAAALLVLASCGVPPAQPSVTPTSAAAAEAATLSSLEQVDDHPLYVMHYVGSYSAQAGRVGAPHAVSALPLASSGMCNAAWGCSLFAALGNQDDRLLGRNFDWQFSPALLLFTDPTDGYASVSIVDIAYLGFDGERSRHMLELSIDERRALLDAPFLPFDGMNEMGIAVGMAAVPEGKMRADPAKPTIDSLRAIREILDHAATVDEAVAVLNENNIDMGSVPIHYLIASASGESALVEFYEGKMYVFRNQADWQTVTNFLVASTHGEPDGQCWRYDRMSRRLEELQGRISSANGMSLLSSVSQGSTQWSVIYHVSSGDIEVVMGRGYSEAPRTFHLQRAAGE